MEDLSKDLSIGDLFDKELETSTENLLSKKLENYKSNLSKFLKPPYTFELPPSDKKLIPEDQGYDYYVCRTNIATNIHNAIEEILRDKDINIPEENRQRMDFIKNEIFNLARKEGFRTVEDMEYIKKLTGEADAMASSINVSVH